MEIATMLVPEDKMSPTVTMVLKVISVIVALALLVMFVVGISLIADGDDRVDLGVLLLVASIVVFVALIVLAIVAHIKHNR